MWFTIEFHVIRNSTMNYFQNFILLCNKEHDIIFLRYFIILLLSNEENNKERESEW